MLVTFDESTFRKDLDSMVAHQDRYNKPLVVLPTEKDVKYARTTYGQDTEECHVTFISFDYFYSKKGVADDTYDHIDFFRLDKVVLNRSFETPVGRATVVRTKKKAKKEEETA